MTNFVVFFKPSTNNYVALELAEKDPNAEYLWSPATAEMLASKEGAARDGKHTVHVILSAHNAQQAIDVVTGGDRTVRPKFQILDEYGSFRKKRAYQPV